MRRPEPLDPAVANDLEALEAALAGAPDADAELAVLVREVRAVAPRPAAAAREALDARAAAGFPKPDGRAARRGGPHLRSVFRAPLLVPALGAAAAALVALVVVVALLGGGDAASERSTAGAGAAREQSGGAGAASSASPPADSAAGTADAPPAPAPGSTGTVPAPVPGTPSRAGVPPVGALTGPAAAPPAAPPAAPARRVERTVRLALGARASRFDSVTDGVVRTTQRAGGFVADSQIRRDGSGGTATFELRIPAGRLDTALAGLSRLAHVRSIEQGTTDLTGATDGTAARLRDARTRRRALVAALATASGARAVRLRARLASARARERSLDRALRTLRTRTSYATVDLTVSASRESGAAPAHHDRWTPADAWRDARRGLEVVAGVLIIVLALALPLALVGGAGALGAAALRRRRREAALDVV